jgi:oligopeptide transport system permease protein
MISACWQFITSSKLVMAAVVLLTIIIGATITGPQLSRWDGEEMDWEALEAPPSATHWFGTDLVGRDLFVRTLQGARVSFTVAAIAVTVSLAIGIPWGAAAGLIGGRTDQLMMRIVDGIYCLPGILIVILLVVLFGHNQYLLFAALGAISWLTIARIVRGQTLRLRNAAFIEAARSMGLSTSHILRRHVIPNVIGPIVVYTTLAIPGVILAESFISFLGLGIQEPDTSWGVLVSDGTQTMESSPWLLIFPGSALAITIWCLNTIGDRLRDYLDSQTNRRLSVNLQAHQRN